MHILMITPNLPRPGGGANTRDYYMLKALTSQHTVSLLTPMQEEPALPDDITHLKELTNSLYLVQPEGAQPKRRQQLLNVIQGKSYILQSYFSDAIQKMLNSLLTTTTVDAILFESALMAGYQVPISMPVFIDQHNLEYEILERTFQLEKGRLRRWYNWRESQLVKPAEIERCRNATAVTVTSERERAILQNYLPQKNIATVPNGVDITMFHKTLAKQYSEIPGRIVFTGSMNYYPNINAALYFARHCWPLIKEQVPDATWQIVGREPPEEICALRRLPDVEVTGSVPDVRPYLAQAMVTIAPLQIGGGTRLKILEAFAMQKAMVSTSLGCEGLNVLSQEHLLVADQPEAFAQAVVSLLNNAELRQQLGIAGRNLVENHYSWEQCGKRLLQVVNQLEKRMRL